MKRQLLFFLCLLWGCRLSAQQAFEPALQAAAAGAYTRAIGLLQAYIDANPGRRYEDAHAWWLIGQYELALGDVAAAELANEASRRLRARILSDEIAENHVLAARIDIARARYERALRALDEAASLPMEDYRLLASLYLYRGLALAGRQQWEEADQSFHYARETLRLVAGDGSPELADFYRQQLACWPCAAAADRTRLWAAASELLPAETQPLLRARLLRALAMCGDTEENAAEALALLRRAGGAGLQEEAALRLDYARLLRDTAVALAQLDTARQLLWPATAGEPAVIADRRLLAELLQLQAVLQVGSGQLQAAVATARQGVAVGRDNYLLGLSPAGAERAPGAVGLSAAALAADRLMADGDPSAVDSCLAEALLLAGALRAALPPPVSASALLKAERQWSLTPADADAQAAALQAWAAVAPPSVPPLTPGALRSRLGRREVAIVYTQAAGRLYAFVVDQKTLTLKELDGGDQLAATPAAQYAQLLEPLEQLLRGKSSLLLLPEGDLTALDWPALVQAGGQSRSVRVLRTLAE